MQTVKSSKKVAKGSKKASKKVAKGSNTVSNTRARVVSSIAATIATPAPVGSHDPGYDFFLKSVASRFQANAAGQPLFTTDAFVDDRTPAFVLPRDSKTGAPGRVIRGLFAAYLRALPAEHQQHHTCRACEQFFDRYGGLVTIDSDGRTHSAVWNVDDAPPFYRPAVREVLAWIHRSKVTGVFLSSEKVLGQPKTGAWHHFAVTNQNQFKHPLLSESQMMAEKLQDYETVQRALSEFRPATIDQAVTLLRSEQLYRSEKVLGPAEWLQKLYTDRASTDAIKGRESLNDLRANIVWKAVATAPAGFCHPRSSMIGTLLEDIESGHTFEAVARQFAEKMNPRRYQRPQAAPKAGAIAAAEIAIEKLASAGSLNRRYARIDEIEALWRPTQPEENGWARASRTVFGHLVAKQETPTPQLQTPPITMTWDKFSRVVLPTADKIEFFAPNRHDTYTALVTAVDPNSPPILQWDREDVRNPVSWYNWDGGSTPSMFNLRSGVFHEVTAVCFQPSMWNGCTLEHQGESVIFLLKGAKDLAAARAGNALFPEILKAEYHSMKSVIEAYSKSAKLQGLEEASACGVRFGKGSKRAWDNLFRVTSGKTVSLYKLDRWD